MCGILGTLPTTDPALFDNSLSMLSHRGPDGLHSKHIDGHISMGHARLAITDFSAQAIQPMAYEHLNIILNGEIYNYIELREELKTKGFRFSTNSDAEVVLASYLNWGPDCLKRFNGMWAIALWDSKEHSLFLSRDRFGKKPLFYTTDNNFFAFASEMKALIPLMRDVDISPDFKAMTSDIFGYESGENCLIKGIKRFPAGHYALFKNKTLNFHSYWNTFDHILPSTESYEKQQSEFSELFIDACRLRMRTPAKIGLTVSGGLDSGAVSAVVQHLNMSTDKNVDKRKNIEAFTTIIQDSTYDESEYARLLSAETGLTLHSENIESKKALDNIFNDYYYQEEIYHTPSYPIAETYRVMHDNNIKVSLDGHGADELFSGYGKQMFLSFLDAGFKPHILKEITNTFNNSMVYEGSSHTIVKHPLPAYLKTLVWYSLYHKKTYRGAQSNEQEKEMIGRMGYLNYGLYHIFHHSILPVLLRNYDRYSMRHGVEVRMPFMDHRVVAYSMGLPWQSKIRNGYTKAIIRDSLAPYIPESIRTRKSKTGFQAPINKWFAGTWRAFLMDEMSSVDFANCPVIDPENLKNVTLKFLNSNTKNYMQAEQLYKQWSPYFWWQGFYKKVRP